MQRNLRVKLRNLHFKNKLLGAANWAVWSYHVLFSLHLVQTSLPPSALSFQVFNNSRNKVNLFFKTFRLFAFACVGTFWVLRVVRRSRVFRHSVVCRVVFASLLLRHLKSVDVRNQRLLNRSKQVCLVGLNSLQFFFSKLLGRVVANVNRNNGSVNNRKAGGQSCHNCIRRNLTLVAVSHFFVCALTPQAKLAFKRRVANNLRTELSSPLVVFVNLLADNRFAHSLHIVHAQVAVLVNRNQVNRTSNTSSLGVKCSSRFRVRHKRHIVRHHFLASSNKPCLQFFQLFNQCRAQLFWQVRVLVLPNVSVKEITDKKVNRVTDVSRRHTPVTPDVLALAFVDKGSSTHVLLTRPLVNVILLVFRQLKVLSVSNHLVDGCLCSRANLNVFRALLVLACFFSNPVQLTLLKHCFNFVVTGFFVCVVLVKALLLSAQLFIATLFLTFIAVSLVFLVQLLLYQLCVLTQSRQAFSRQHLLLFFVHKNRLNLCTDKLSNILVLVLVVFNLAFLSISQSLFSHANLKVICSLSSRLHRRTVFRLQLLKLGFVLSNTRFVNNHLFSRKSSCQFVQNLKALLVVFDKLSIACFFCSLNERLHIFNAFPNLVSALALKVFVVTNTCTQRRLQAFVKKLVVCVLRKRVCKNSTCLWRQIRQAVSNQLSFRSSFFCNLKSRHAVFDKLVTLFFRHAGFFHSLNCMLHLCFKDVSRTALCSSKRLLHLHRCSLSPSFVCRNFSVFSLLSQLASFVQHLLTVTRLLKNTLLLLCASTGHLVHHRTGSSKQSTTDSTKERRLPHVVVVGVHTQTLVNRRLLAHACNAQAVVQAFLSTNVVNHFLNALRAHVHKQELASLLKALTPFLATAQFFA